MDTREKWKKFKIVGFTPRRSWENDITREKHTQHKRETFFGGGQHHLFFALLDSPYSVVIYLQNRNEKYWKLRVLHAVKVDKMAKIFTKSVSEWDSNPGHPRDILNPLISASVASKREG